MMEIKYEKFNEWLAAGEKMTDLVSDHYHLDDVMHNHLKEIGNWFNKIAKDIRLDRSKPTNDNNLIEVKTVIIDALPINVADKIIAINSLIENWNKSDLVIEFYKELELNIVSIDNEQSLIRYVNYLKSKMNSLKYDLKPSISPDIFIILDFFGSITNKENSQFFLLPCFKWDNFDIVNSLNTTLLVFNDTLNTDYIDQALNKLSLGDAGNQDLVINHDITANTHKLILLHKLGLFKVLYDNHRGELGNVRFAKLLGTLLGVDPDPKKQEGFRKSVDDYTTETFLKKNAPKTVERPTAIKKVNAYLAELGLLNLIDSEIN